MTSTQIIEQEANERCPNDVTKPGATPFNRTKRHCFVLGAFFALSEPGLWRELLMEAFIHDGYLSEDAAKITDNFITHKTGK